MAQSALGLNDLWFRKDSARFNVDDVRRELGGNIVENGGSDEYLLEGRYRRGQACTAVRIQLGKDIVEDEDRVAKV